MKKIALLALAASLGALSTLAFARDDREGPWMVVFTESTTAALKRTKKKVGDDFGVSEQLTEPFNGLAELGFHPVHVLPAGDRLIIVAKKNLPEISSGPRDNARQKTLCLQEVARGMKEGGAPARD